MADNLKAELSRQAGSCDLFNGAFMIASVLNLSARPRAILKLRDLVTLNGYLDRVDGVLKV